jgi:3-dehydroquinate synthase
MKQIGTNGWVGLGAIQRMNELLAEHDGKVFFLVDENTHEHCLPLVLGELSNLKEYEILEVEAGEGSKCIEVITNLWISLAELEADRSALLINLGGGMITDLGGFLGSTYKRGIRFWHVPTSLLAMVDAAFGGKTGIDVNNIKNLVGTFLEADEVFVYPPFLLTLPERELRSGFAEVVKHGLIDGSELLQDSLEAWSSQQFGGIIEKAVKVKVDIVDKDMFEQGLRKRLNFGHTIGHAVESYFLEKGEPILHGEAVAAGLLMECWLSRQFAGFDPIVFDAIVRDFRKIFPDLYWPEKDDVSILYWLQYDKKNEAGTQRYVLLNAIGSCLENTEVPIEDSAAALAWYRNVVSG